MLCEAGKGKPLVEDYELLTVIRITVPDACIPTWPEAAAVQQAAAAPFSPLVPVIENGELQVRLAPRAREDQRTTAAIYRRDRLPALLETAKRASGGTPIVRLEGQSITSLCDALPPLERCPPAYTRALLRFQDLGDVLPALEQIQRWFPGLDCYVRYRQSIQRLQSIRFLVEKGTLALEVGFVVGLFFLLGMLVYLDVSAKGAEAAVLRVHGLLPRAVVRVFQVQLALRGRLPMGAFLAAGTLLFLFLGGSHAPAP
jgi:hypothetical protein